MTAGVAKKLQEEIPHGIVLDEYRNVGCFAILVYLCRAKYVI